MAGPPTLSRKRPAPTGDEEATTQLKLGEFTSTPCLSVAECNVLLDTIRQNGGRVPLNTDIYVKTKEYVAAFSRFKDAGVVGHVDTLLDGLVKVGKIVPFEKAQLATLCCDTADEAKTLIPSLEGKISEEELQQVLNDISKLRDFT